MAFAKDQSNPFSDWSSHINKPVYSIDGKRLGLLRKTSSDFMIISGGLIPLLLSLNFNTVTDDFGSFCKTEKILSLGHQTIMVSFEYQ
jgi:hypothetical protein